MSHRRTRLPFLVGLGLLLAGLLVGTRPGAEESIEGSPATATTPARVALLEWQFPTSPDSGLCVHPRQTSLLAAWGDDPRALAFHPNLSDENAGDSERLLEKLMRHAALVYDAFVGGREVFPEPFLLNISRKTPEALRLVIQEGVRIVSISSGSETRLMGLDAVLKEHPEVLFVIAAPHIAGNDISVEAFAERPSVLATMGYANAILAGCLEFYDDDVKRHVEGVPLGSAENPFTVSNQPVTSMARRYFLMSCRGCGGLPEGLRTTSGAAPVLASLLAALLDHEESAGRPTPAAALLEALDRVMHRASAQEESGEVEEVGYFTLETVLLNQGRPPPTESTWRDLPDPPAPLRFRP